MHRHFWQSSQHTHAARGGGGAAAAGTEASSALHTIFPGKSVGVVPEFLNASSVAGLQSPMETRVLIPTEAA
jgi:hypothetical protein